MKQDHTACLPHLLTLAALLLILLGLLELPAALLHSVAVGLGLAVLFLTLLWKHHQKQREFDFANSVCETLDALINDREPENYRPYEDSQLSKVQGKLLQYHDRTQSGQRQSEETKQTIQELVSDISHQVKTPIANIRIFTDILRQHELPEEKRTEFLSTLSAQVSKLDFLMQSLMKMSRLETGTFVLHMENASLYDTIAQAVSSIAAMADRKQIQIDINCSSQETIRHDPKWTAEALGNLLDNAVKYTPEGGTVYVSVRPWQFYIRIDITDTGIGIPAEHYNDVFKRFYRAQSSAAAEGVGLGLYLAQGLITRQKGYITLASEVGRGSTFSVFLLR
ncbi:MAG: HAMP domain-containing histidine kinase [Lachnospiraceae bacterium]|nr:HAMP domain-containing histidine kinase [Lachnospiraceae bacterium]